MADESGGRRAATASYIEEMLGELAELSRGIDGDFLVFLIEMAKLEATEIKRGQPSAGRRRAKKKGDESPSAELLASRFVKKSSNSH